MSREEMAIARAIAENLGMRGDKLATDVGTVQPFLPPCREEGNTFAVRNWVDVRVEYDVEVKVSRRRK